MNYVPAWSSDNGLDSRWTADRKARAKKVYSKKLNIDKLAVSESTLKFDHMKDAVKWFAVMAELYVVLSSTTEIKDGWVEATIRIPWGPDGRLLPARKWAE